MAEVKKQIDTKAEPVAAASPARAPKMAPTLPTAKPGIADLHVQTDSAAKNDLNNRLGTSVDTEALKNNPSELDSAITRLAATFENLGEQWEKFMAILAPLGIGEEEAEYRIYGSAEDRPDGGVDSLVDVAPAAKGKANSRLTDRLKIQEIVAKRGLTPDGAAKLGKIETFEQRYELCKKGALHWLQEKNMKQWLEPQALERFVAYMMGTIKYESGWNPFAAVNKAHPDRAALGLGQGIPKTRAAYEKASGMPKWSLDFTDPDVAIDFVAWHAVDALQYFKNGDLAIKPDSPTLFYDLYLTHNCGPAGARAIRNYIKSPTQQNFDAMARTGFLTNPSKSKKFEFQWQDNEAYTRRVAQGCEEYLATLQSNRPVS